MKHSAKYRSVLLSGRGIAAKDLYTQHYLRLLVTILISFITTAIIFYPEEFRLGPYPFSYLGRRATPSGFQNTYSRLVFDTGLFLCGYTMYILARYYHRNHPVPDSTKYEFLSYMSAVGFVMMIVPCDIAEIKFVHAIGSGFVVGSHLFIACLRIIAVHHFMKSWIVVLLLMTLVISVVSYASLWCFNLPNHAFFQKPALAAIIYVEMYGSSISRYFGEQNIMRPLHSFPYP